MLPTPLTDSLAHHVLREVLSHPHDSADQTRFWSSMVLLPLEDRQRFVNAWLEEHRQQWANDMALTKTMGHRLGSVLPRLLPTINVSQSLNRWLGDVARTLDQNGSRATEGILQERNTLRLNLSVLKAFAVAFNTAALHDVKPGHDHPTIAFNHVGTLFFQRTFKRRPEHAGPPASTMAMSSAPN